MTWLEAAERFGSDKPDVRFGLELVELTDVFSSTEFNAFKAPCVKGIRVPRRCRVHTIASRRSDRSRQAMGSQGPRVDARRAAKRGSRVGVARRQVPERRGTGVARIDARGRPGDLLLIVADERPPRRHVLGLLRLEIGRPPVNEGGLQFLWVVDFPLFEAIDEATGKPVSAHHPFTMPHADDLELLDGVVAGGDPTALLSVRSQAYDLVLNGWELGSGSVRIHRGDIQSKIFGLLGIGAAEAQSKFGFLLDAFRFGAPPHAGFAFGIDRLVALLVGEENIREVIAFPKTQSGSDPLTQAPTDIDPAQLAELGLRLLPRSAD
jgi:aspartyl-tRNA synthetase